MIAARLLIRRAAALAILAAIPIAIWIVLADPLWQAWSDADETEERSGQLITEFRQTLAKKPIYEAQLKALDTRRGSMPGLVEGASPALAAATLQGDIKRTIESHGGQVRSTQDLSAVREHGFERIAVRIDWTASVEALSKILYEIEGHTPYLFVDNLEVRAPDDPKPENFVSGKPILTIRCDIYGYRPAGET
jgi:hypothetical protein